MAKKTVGYVHLEWTCPACGGRNDGEAVKCAHCGAPQPEDVQFQQAAASQLIEDEAIVAQAKQGPDIHCPFCGTRNPADATQCSQCLADLTEATARQAGQVLGAHREGPVPDVACPYCQTTNPATAKTCRNCGASLAQPAQRPQAKTAKRPAAGGNPMVKTLVIVIALLVLAGACAFFILSGRTEEMTGRVTDVLWTRSVVIEGLVPVERQDWLDEIPAGAEVGSCRQEVRRTQDEPAPNSEEVCGTPYTVDTGTGVGEVVQDCVYQVYDDLCAYTVEEWQGIDEAVLSGSDMAPAWPNPNLNNSQRLGGREEAYEVRFDVDGRVLTYRPDSAEEFNQFTPGSRWTLEVNTFDAVRSAQPAD